MNANITPVSYRSRGPRRLAERLKRSNSTKTLPRSIAKLMTRMDKTKQLPFNGAMTTIVFNPYPKQPKN